MGLTNGGCLMLHLKAAAFFIVFVGLLAGMAYGMFKYPDTAMPIIGGLLLISALAIVYGLIYLTIKDWR